ncbi:MAG: TIGR00341 family protein [Flavobacteriales bacterium]|nr:TIGR00341 family protein [Flavobacteriales bacterium]
MALRMIELFVKHAEEKHIDALRELSGVTSFWQTGPEGKTWVVKAILPAEETEAFTDKCARILGSEENYSIVLLPIEALLPREKEEKDDPEDKGAESAQEKEEEKKVYRVSRDELYHSVVDGMELSRIYILMVVLSGIVASIGMLRDNLAVIIGAMVIAPLLGPNVGFSLATTLGDQKLMKQSIATNFSGIGIVLVISVAIGITLNVDPTTPAILERSEITLSDIALAICAGVAGVLSYTSGVPAALIGVMVAVALLPPLAAVGLLAGSENYAMALGALLLFITNIICINLAGTGTFLALGVEPRRWWEAKKANEATWRAIAAWVVMLLVLGAIIYFYY